VSANSAITITPITRLEQTITLVGSHMNAIDDAVREAVDTRVKRLATAAVPLEAALERVATYAPMPR
jgi:hypothetical protein